MARRASWLWGTFFVIAPLGWALGRRNERLGGPWGAFREPWALLPEFLVTSLAIAHLVALARGASYVARSLEVLTALALAALVVYRRWIVPYP